MTRRYVGRLAPSPTGALHLGNVRTFMIAYLRARAVGGRVIFRMEDLDHPKDKPGAAEEVIRDLRWLGFEWDEAYTQSQRVSHYRAALDVLKRQNLVYPCVCSRKDVEAAQSAPHTGEQLYYPGTCRDRFSDWSAAEAFLGRPPCWRFRVAAETVVSFTDVFAGDFRQAVATTLGDFPLARHPAGAGYTLAAVVDDFLMGVTEVVRGDDLLPATPAQILLRRALGYNDPLAYCHVPLVVGADGRRLAKRHGDTRIAAYRAAGLKPEQILGRLAHTCGWCEAEESMTLQSLIPRFNLSTIPKEPLCLKSPF